jgi:hypothetical protein
MGDVVGPKVITEPLRQITVPGLLHVCLLVNRRQKLPALRDGGFGTTLVVHILGSADRLPLFTDFLMGQSCHGLLPFSGTEADSGAKATEVLQANTVSAVRNSN